MNAQFRSVETSNESAATAGRREHEQRLGDIDRQFAEISAKIDKTQVALQQAKTPIKELDALLTRRAAIVAAGFTGDAVPENAAELEAHIEATNNAAPENAAAIQGASSALVTLRERIDELSRRRALELAKRKQILFAQAHAAVMEFRSELEAAALVFTAVQARFLGLLCAQDYLRPDNAPPASVGMPGKVSYRAPAIQEFHRYAAERPIASAAAAIARETLQRLGVDTTGL